jgi:hypothetical protein
MLLGPLLPLLGLLLAPLAASCLASSVAVWPPRELPSGSTRFFGFVGCFFGAGLDTVGRGSVVFIIIAAVDGALLPTRMQPCVSEKVT